MSPIKVVIVDDHTLFREGLKRILSFEKEILVVGEASRGDEVAKVVERGKPDVLLLDIRMPRADLVQMLIDVKERSPSTKVLVLTAFSEEENVFSAAKGGARGYALKGISSATLMEAIKTVHGGGVWIDKDLASADVFLEIAEAFPSGEPQNDVTKSLTKREVQILKLVAQGLTNEEIGQAVFISEKTVKAHLTNIFAKLRVNNRFKAALMIMK